MHTGMIHICTTINDVTKFAKARQNQFRFFFISICNAIAFSHNFNEYTALHWMEIHLNKAQNVCVDIWKEYVSVVNP